MAYNKTNWQNLPNQSTPLSANNLNKIENELEKLDPTSPYTWVEGTYTTAAWSEGTATNCTWEAPRTGLYIIWARFLIDDDTKAYRYKKLQLRGSSTKLISNELVWESEGASSSSAIVSYQGSTLIYATQGQDVVPYIHTPAAGIIWNIKIVGLFLK